MMEMVLVAVVMGQPWYGPLHMIAAIGMGKDGVLPPPAPFEMGVAAIAMAIHVSIALFYGLVLSTLLLAFRRPGDGHAPFGRRLGRVASVTQPRD